LTRQTLANIYTTNRRQAGYRPLPPSLTSLTKHFNFPEEISLQLRKFAVISHMRTNFTEMPREIAAHPGSRERYFQGRRGGESESLEEEAIEIGNSYRTHPNPAA
jgi:hypothetical protein